MWIEVDESLVDLIPAANASQCAALDSIALSAFHGKNFLYAKRRTLDWMCSQEISSASKSVCLWLQNRLSEYSALREFVKVKLIVVSGGKHLNFCETGRWELPISVLEENPVASCTLLAENLTDADIYLLAAEHYKKHHKLNGVSINLIPSGGGGNQIYPSFAKFIDRRDTYCLSVTDTDKDYPGAESNDPSKNCRDIANERRWVAAHIDVPARELENILPINIVEDAISSDNGAVDLHLRFERIKSRIEHFHAALLYCDLKMGTKYSWALGKHGNREKAEFWEGYLNSRQPAIRVCGNGCDEGCDCFMIESLGDKVAEKFLEFCRNNSTYKQYERMKTSSNANQWLAVGNAVFDWGVALSKSRS